MTRRLTMLSRSKVHRSETRRPTSDTVELERLSWVGAGDTGRDRVSAAEGRDGRSPPQPSAAQTASIKWLLRRRIRDLIPVSRRTQVSKGVLKIGHFCFATRESRVQSRKSRMRSRKPGIATLSSRVQIGNLRTQYRNPEAERR